jgi:protein involved in polysaccharide export with SLBB domain
MRSPIFVISAFICVHLWPLFGQQSVPSDYILGPDDAITLSVANLDEMSGKPMRIDTSGDINLPLVGHIHASDLTAAQLESR